MFYIILCSSSTYHKDKPFCTVGCQRRYTISVVIKPFGRFYNWWLTGDLTTPFRKILVSYHPGLEPVTIWRIETYVPTVRSRGKKKKLNGLKNIQHKLKRGCVPAGGYTTGSEDSVAPILVDCAAFDGKRTALVRQIGAFVPGDLVSRVVESPSAWAWAVTKFAVAVTSRKVQAGRITEGRTWPFSPAAISRKWPLPLEVRCP